VKQDTYGLTWNGNIKNIFRGWRKLHNVELRNF